MLPKKTTENPEITISHYKDVKNMIVKNKEFITPDRLYDMCIVICSDCGKLSPIENSNCPKCGVHKLILKESTINSLKR